MQMKVIDSLLQLFGGYGYMTEYPISRFFVDARIQRIYGGTNEIMKEIVARGILGRWLKEMDRSIFIELIDFLWESGSV